MSILIDLKPDHEITVDADFLSGVTNLGWSVSGTSNKAVAVQNDDTAYISIHPDGTEADDAGWFIQYALDGTVEPSLSYLVVLKAREAGSGNTWGGATPKSVNVSLVFHNGQTRNHSIAFPNIGSTNQTYVASFLAADTDDTLTPDSIMLRIYSEPGIARKQLLIDSIGLSEL